MPGGRIRTSRAGTQPPFGSGPFLRGPSADGVDQRRYHIAYNGEIYNHLEIRRQLEATGEIFHWRGHSDTETILAAISKWGLERTLESMVGMFALALWMFKREH